jgi:hypothetical protein
MPHKKRLFTLALALPVLLTLCVPAWATWTFLTNWTDISSLVTKDSTWHQVDLSRVVPVGTTTVILSVNPQNTSPYVNVRPVGASDNRPRKIGGSFFNGSQLIVKLDRNRKFEAITDNVAQYWWLVGYTDDGHMLAASVEKTSRVGDWADCDVSRDGVPSGATGVWLETDADNTVRTYGLRKKGESHGQYYHLGGGNNYVAVNLGWVALDENRKFQRKINNVALRHFLWGYTGAEVVPVIPPVKKQGTVTGWVDATDPCLATGAIGVIVEAVNANPAASAPIMGIRIKGSKQGNNTCQVIRSQHHHFMVCGLDSARTFQINIANTKYSEYWIVAYIKDPKYQDYAAGTYYVANASDDLAAGTEAAPWKTIDKINGSTFAPGSTIKFKKGDKWPEQLIPPSSGSAGKPITFTSYGSGSRPIISGLEDVTGVAGDWRNEGGNVWSRPETRKTKTCVFNNATFGRLRARASLTADYQFYWGSNKLYVYAVGDPTRYYTSIQEAIRPHCINTNGKDYLDFTDLQCEGNNISSETDNNVYAGTFRVYIGSAYINITSCYARWAWGAGYKIMGADHVALTNSEAHYIGGTGSLGDGVNIRHNPLTGASSTNITVSGGNYDNAGRLGVAIVGLIGGTIENLAVASSNGIDIEPTSPRVCKKIKIKGCAVTNGSIAAYGAGPTAQVREITINGNEVIGGTLSLRNIDNLGEIANGSMADGDICQVNDNYVHDTVKAAIALNGSKGVRVFRNRVVKCSSRSGAFYAHAQANGVWGSVYYNLFNVTQTGAKLQNTTTDAYVDLKFHNNVFYGYSFRGLYDYMVVGTPTHQVWEAKNNIFYGVGSGNYLHIDKVARGTKGTCDHNCYHTTAGDGGAYFHWAGHSGNKTFAQFQSAVGQEAHGKETDPLFINPGIDFHLQSGSPCINAGVNVGLTKDYAGNPIIGIPDMGVYEYQFSVPAIKRRRHHGIDATKVN